MTGCGGWRNGLLGLIEGTRWRILQRPSGGHAHHVDIEMGRRQWDLIEAWLCFYLRHKDVSYRGFTIGFITHFCFFMLAKCSSNVILLTISCTIILSCNFASLIFLSHLLAILAFLKIWPVFFSDYMCISVLNELPSCPYP